MAEKYDNFLSKLEDLGGWNEDQERALLEPYVYLSENPGKDIRTQLIDAFNAWVGLSDEALLPIKGVVSRLHTASLLIDDIEDSSELRRGSPVAHKIFGVAQTLNTANYVYFLAYKELSKLRGAPQDGTLHQYITEELSNLHRGQGMELFWRDNQVCPSEEEYLAMINNKTGGLFRIAIHLMLICSTNTPETLHLIPLVNLIGIIFQVRDDYVNLTSDVYATSKGFCEDITEGKFSFPIIHAIRSDTSNRRIINILRQRTENIPVKEWMINYMEKHTDSFTYTKKVILNLIDQALELVMENGGNEALVLILNKLKV